MIIDFTVSNAMLRRTDNNYLVNLSKGYLQYRFSFTTDEWDELDKYVLFTVKGKNCRCRVSDGEVFSLPDELHNHKYFYVQAYGMNDELNRHLTTNTIVISLDKSIIKPLLINDEKIENMVNMLGDIINEKINNFKVDGNKLICYYDETPLTIIPIQDQNMLDFLTEDYIEIDTRKLTQKGLLFYEIYKLS